MGKSRFKHVSVKKLSVRKRSVKNGSVFVCSHDGSACTRPRVDFDEDLGEFVSYSNCFTIGRDSKIHHVCSRFKGKLPDASFCEDLVRKALAEEDLLRKK